MEKIRPLLIVMTPVRNEAWVLHAFLKTTSTWADFIIIADQMSTDGSRDIIKEYSDDNKSKTDKADIILIDNKNPYFNEAERQAMLVAKAREISAGRDTILFGLVHSWNYQDGTLDINVVSFYINVPRRDRLIKILQRGDNIEESYRRNLSDVGQFDGIEDEVDFVLYNEGYQKSIEEMAKEVLYCLDN